MECAMTRLPVSLTEALSVGTGAESRRRVPAHTVNFIRQAWGLLDTQARQWGVDSATYQICNLIFFPLSSTVLILKSTPMNKANKCEAETVKMGLVLGNSPGPCFRSSRADAHEHLQLSRHSTHLDRSPCAAGSPATYPAFLPLTRSRTVATVQLEIHF